MKINQLSNQCLENNKFYWYSCKMLKCDRKKHFYTR